MSGETARKKAYVYQSVFADIVRQNYDSNSIITENQLIEKYQMSKSPVREALVELCADDILVALPRIGYRVKPVSIKDIKDSLTLRSMIELTALDQSFPRLGESEVNTLSALYSESRDVAEKKDVYMHWELNTRFHVTLCSFSGNKYFKRTLESLMRSCFRGITSYYEDSWNAGSDKGRSEWHKILIEAIVASDKEAALDALRSDLADLHLYFSMPVMQDSFIVQ